MKLWRWRRRPNGTESGAQHSSTDGPLAFLKVYMELGSYFFHVTSLLALALTTASGDSRLGNVMDGCAMTQLCRNGGVGLHEWLECHKGET